MQHRITSSIAVIALLGGAACSSDSTGLGANGASQLAFMATTGTSASASLVPTTVGSHTLDLTSVSLTVTRAELKRATTDACPGDDEGDDDHSAPSGSTGSGSCGELKVGPSTIDLPLSGSVVTLPANAIPAGTYRELELRVSQVRLKGTFDGKAFDVTVPVSVKSEIEFSTPLTVTEGAATSITVSVPVTNWLMNADGSLIDPNAIAGSPTLSTQVKNRIRASFHAFEDRDHDGHDDHGRD